MIRYTAFLMLLIAGAGVTVFAQTPTATPRQIDELARLSNVWMQAAMDHDMKTLEGLMADDYARVYPSQDQVTSRSVWLRDLANQRTRRFRYRNPKVNYYRKSLAIVNSVFVVDADIDGRPLTPITSVTDVWEKRHGKWQVVTRYETRAAELLETAAAAAAGVAQAPTPTTTKSDELARLANVWMQAVKDHDMKTLESLMADNYALAFPSIPNGFPRKDWLGNVGNIETKSFSYQHLKVRYYGKSLAIVNAVLLHDSELNGQPRAGAITSVSDVWEKRHGKWQVVTRYATRPEELRGPTAAPPPK
jgi:ketosteroid isomerase-like protein